MFKEYAPLVFRPRWDPHMIRWGLSFLHNCMKYKADANTVTMLKLGLYSKQMLEHIRNLTGVEFHNVREGILHIFYDQYTFDHAISQARYQETFSCKQDILDGQACIRLEPALEYCGRDIVGGIHSPLDESGDAKLFTEQLAALCEKEYGTVFQYDTAVESIKTDKGKITSVQTSKGEFKADKYVMALGSYSYLHLRKLGIHVPIYPMKGYSVTIPANHYTPNMSLTDAEMKIVYSRVGDVMRVAGTAEFAGYNDSMNNKRVDNILHAVQRLFPKCDFDQKIMTWACLRPSTPDGPPIIGKTKYENLFLNTGHGTLGWTQAAGSGRLLLDIMIDRETEISMTGLTLDRY
jgi:D-amino-acid dehydrogenase